MSANNITGTTQDVNSHAEGVWEGPALDFHGITLTPFSEPSEGPYVCIESDGRTLNRVEIEQFIAALSGLLMEAGK